MSLYTSVYWTKRVSIVFGLILFLCSGIRVFQYVSGKFTKNTPLISADKPELGFGTLDKLTLTPLNTPPNFTPTDWRNTTIKGNLDVDNGYPLEKNTNPLANVYKIQENTIDLNSTETPRKIAQNLGFTKEWTQVSPAVLVWTEGSKDLEINGQYLLIKYKDNAIRKQKPNGETLLISSDSDSIKSYFADLLKNYGIVSDLTSYKFQIQYLDYDSSTNEFVNSGVENAGSFIRLNAIRIYPNLVKNAENVVAEGLYPNYAYSNNYIILPSQLPKNAAVKDNVAELSLYNWPIDVAGGLTNKNIQTYNIKTPKVAFEELKNNNKYLMSATDWNTGEAYPVVDLAGITRVELIRLKLGMYEDVVNTTYVQPVYLFICQAEKDGKLIELDYYVPALTNSVTK